MRLLAIDFEGTSREPRRGWGCQLGIALMDDEEVLASDEFLIRCPTHWATGKPLKECDAYSLRVSGLTLETIETHGLEPNMACHRLWKFVRENAARNLPVVAYNASYDMECYRNLLFDGGEFSYSDRRRYPYQEILSPTWICAFATACRFQHAPSLDEAATRYELKRSGESHDALEDAILAARVYLRANDEMYHEPYDEPFRRSDLDANYIDRNEDDDTDDDSNEEEI